MIRAILTMLRYIMGQRKIRYAIGITAVGKQLLIDTSFNWVLTIDKNLVSLEVPEGVTIIHCNKNKLTTLIWPSTTHTVMCDKELFDYDNCEISHVDIIY